MTILRVLAKGDRLIGSYNDKIQMQQQIRKRGIDGKNYLLW
jgi:vancomycin permeability regulator SanA